MEVLKIDNKESLDIAAEMIKGGGVIVYPTDTVYGLGADFQNEKAVKRIFEIKKKQEFSPLLLIVPDVCKAERLAFIDEKTRNILSKIWPGPVTVVLKRKDDILDVVTTGKETIAIRVPNHKPSISLAEKCGGVLISTSANVSGQLPTGKISEIIETFSREGIQPDLIIDAGDLKESLPSTVLDLSESKPKILREGAFSREDLIKAGVEL